MVPVEPSAGARNSGRATSAGHVLHEIAEGQDVLSGGHVAAQARRRGLGHGGHRHHSENEEDGQCQRGAQEHAGTGPRDAGTTRLHDRVEDEFREALVVGEGGEVGRRGHGDQSRAGHQPRNIWDVVESI